jgi:hypothetical protein
MVATESKGLSVMEVEPVTLGESPALPIHEAALASVALVHGTPDRGGNLT